MNEKMFIEFVEKMKTFGDSDKIDYEAMLAFLDKNLFTISFKVDPMVTNVTFTLVNRAVLSFSQGKFSSLPRVGTGSFEVAYWKIAIDGSMGDIEETAVCRTENILELLETYI